MGDKYVSMPLTNVAIKYQQNTDEFIAGKVFPEVGVPKQGGLYWVYDKAEWFRTQSKRRAPGTETPGIKWGATTAEFYCHPEGVHSDIDEQMKANYDSIFAGEKVHTELVTQQNLLKREKRFGQKFFAPGIWTGAADSLDQTPATKFDVSGSTPIDYISGKMDEMEMKTGRRPNKLTSGRDVYTVLKNHAQIIGRLGDASVKKANEKIIASLLGIEEYLVTGAIEETANEGGTSSMAWIYSKHMLLTHSPKNPSLEIPSAGYTINWKGYLKGSGFHKIKRFEMPALESMRIEGMMAYDQRRTATDLGILLKDVIS